MEFNGTGADKFADITERAGRPAAAAEPVRHRAGRRGRLRPRRHPSPIPGGSAEISGSFTSRRPPRTWPNVLKYGALPLTFERVQRQTVSADARRRPAPGRPDRRRHRARRWSSSTRCSTTAAWRWWPSPAWWSPRSSPTRHGAARPAHRLRADPAGVCGLIVAIGITADSFIVYFERIRDEVREGRTLRAAVESGWPRARRTILVADFVSFLAAVVLYVLAVGGVRGFAFTLGLTTLIDIVVVFLFTKPLMTLLARTKFFAEGHRWSGLDPKRLGAKPPLRGRRRRRPRYQRPEGGLRCRGSAISAPGSTAARSPSTSSASRKIWYGVSAPARRSHRRSAVRGLNLGVEFKGGAVFSFRRTERLRRGGARPSPRRASAPALVQTSGRRRDAGPDRDGLDTDQSNDQQRGARQGVRRRRRRRQRQVIGPSWGEEISKKAWQRPGASSWCSS